MDLKREERLSILSGRVYLSKKIGQNKNKQIILKRPMVLIY